MTRRRLIVLSVVGCLASSVMATQAEATTIIVDDGQPDAPYQRWVDRSWVSTPDESIVVYERACTSALAPACAYPDFYEDGPAIEISLLYGRRSLFMHEVGHLADYALLSDDERAGFAAILHKRPWTAADGFAPMVAETFADVYSSCAHPERGRSGRRRGYWVGDAWIMRRAVHRRVCRFTRHAVAF